MNNQSEQINELACALSKAQGEILPAVKDSANPFFKSKYADLNSIWNACRMPLSKNGLAVIQTMDRDEKSILLITTLVHSSGQYIRSILPVLTAKLEAQELGKAITYMRRYALAAIAGVAPDDDDDGNTAQGLKNPPPAPVAPTPPVKQFLTTGDVKQIEIMLGDNEELRNKILDHYKVNSFNDIQKKDFNMILSRCSQTKKAESDGTN